MPPLHSPTLSNEQLLNAIALAPEDTVRAVLRALTADDVFKSRIATLMAKLPLRPATTAAENSGESNDASKKRKDATAQICIQCDELFEEGDTSETCSYHPCKLPSNGRMIALNTHSP